MAEEKQRFMAEAGKFGLIELIKVFEDRLARIKEDGSISGVIDFNVFWNLSWGDGYYLLAITKDDEEIVEAIISLIGFQPYNDHYQEAGIYVYGWKRNSEARVSGSGQEKIGKIIRRRHVGP